MKAAIYSRYLASDNRDFVPMMTEYCHQQGFEIYKTLEDDKATDFEEKYPKFRELLEDARNKKFDVVISMNLLSFGWGAWQVMKVLKEFVNNGVHFVFLESNINSINQPDVINLVKSFTKLIDKGFSERSKVVRDACREKGKHLGKQLKFDAVLTRYILESKSDDELMQSFNVSKSTLVRYRKRLGIVEKSQIEQVL